MNSRALNRVINMTLVACILVAIASIISFINAEAYPVPAVIESEPIMRLQFEEIVEEIKEKESIPEKVETESVSIEDYNDIALMARVVMSEASTEPLVGKVAVASTILNRWRLWGKSIRDVINTPNQYSTQDNGKPTDECYVAVYLAMEGGLFPENMIYFRTGRYSDYGTPYVVIGNHYFSCEEEGE